MAWLSSYLILIDMKEIYRTIYDIGYPTIDILISPVYFLYGYSAAAKTYIDKTWMIYTGTLLIIICASVIIHKLLLKFVQINIVTVIQQLTRRCIDYDFF